MLETRHYDIEISDGYRILAGMSDIRSNLSVVVLYDVKYIIHGWKFKE